MKKFSIIILSVFLFGCTVKEQKNTESKPNIIFILVDDLGKEWVSCYGAEDIYTPHVDDLAESGALFNNFYVMPQCTPTRVTLLTGQYPYQHGWVNHWDVPRWGGGAHFDETVNPSIGVEMKKAGYKTCVAGKWQIDDFRVEPDALSRNGFDSYCMWTGYEAGVPKSAERYDKPYIHTNKGSKIYFGQFGPDVFKDHIISFINENKNSPMFIYYPMVLTHTPFVNTPDECVTSDLGKHKAMVRYTDKITGEIVAALEENGIRENTIIIWTTDNGTSRRITGRLNGEEVEGAKSKTTETGVCSPFIVNWPAKIKAGTVSDALVDLTDLFPTFLDLAGVTVESTGLSNKLHGRSFKKVLTGEESKSEREWIMAMGGQNNAKLTDKGVENQWVFRDRVIRNERYKLYVGTNREPEKFFDLKEDPFEKRDILGSLDTEEKVANFKQLSAVINTFPEKDNDPVYKPNPPQEWDVEIKAESQVWKSK